MKIVSFFSLSLMFVLLLCHKEIWADSALPLSKGVQIHPAITEALGETPFLIDANHFTYNEDEEQVYLKGGVSLMYQRFFLFAGELVLHQDDKNPNKYTKMEAKGNVLIVDEDSFFVGSQVSYDFTTQEMVIDSALVMLNSDLTSPLRDTVVFKVSPYTKAWSKALIDLKRQKKKK